MRVTQRVKKLVSSYESDNPGTKSALARLLMEGKLGGTGKALILPIDHAFNKTMVPKFSGLDPEYHFQLAVDSGLSALAAPLDMLEIGADGFAGALPLILQLQRGEPFHGTTNGSVRDALRLGCIGISCAITASHADNSHIVALVDEAKAAGLVVMMWASATDAPDEQETTLESITIAATAASQLGAHIICVRVPTGSTVPGGGVTAPLSDRIRHVGRVCANGNRMVVFAASSMDSDTELFDEIRGIRDGGSQGYVLPPNSLYRPYDAALSLLDSAVKLYQGKA